MVTNEPTLSLTEVMDQHPQLTAFGIGIFDSPGKTPDERRAAFSEGRRELRANEVGVVEIATWLNENITPIKTPTVGSYHVKHVAERAMGKYVTNGELIAAALVAGYTIRYAKGPNPLLGMSERDLKRIDDQT